VYQGAQQNWPTAKGAFVSKKWDVPVYYGPPDRPYIVLGSLDAHSQVQGMLNSPTEDIWVAARRAKELGGDAIIVLNRNSENLGTVSSAGMKAQTASNNSFYGTLVGNSVYGQGYASGSTVANAWGLTSTMKRRSCVAIVIKWLPGVSR
jgi:hypothetical protein